MGPDINNGRGQQPDARPRETIAIRLAIPNFLELAPNYKAAWDRFSAVNPGVFTEQDLSHFRVLSEALDYIRPYSREQLTAEDDKLSKLPSGGMAMAVVLGQSQHSARDLLEEFKKVLLQENGSLEGDRDDVEQAGRIVRAAGLMKAGADRPL